MKWKKGDFVMADWKGCYYKTKIIDVTESGNETKYKIHYDGWSSKWDHIVPESKTGKWSKYTVEAENVANKYIEELKLANTPNKRHTSKRKSRSDEPFVNVEEQKPRLHFPEKLKDILLDDYAKMSKEGLYAQIPAKVTISQIIKDFCAKIAASDEQETMVEVLYEGAKKTTKQTTKHEFTAFAHLVEHLINSLFLYLCVTQDKELVRGLKRELFINNNHETLKPFRPSEYFGVVHLIRLFVKVNAKLDMLDGYDRYSFIKHISALMEHLNNKVNDYYDKDAYYKTDCTYLSSA